MPIPSSPSGTSLPGGAGAAFPVSTSVSTPTTAHAPMQPDGHETGPRRSVGGGGASGAPRECGCQDHEIVWQQVGRRHERQSRGPGERDLERLGETA